MTLLNKVFVFLGLVALIVEFAIFIFEHWYITVCLFVELSFLVLNLCLLILHEDSKQFWLKFRVLLIYVPFLVITVMTLLELSLMGVFLKAKINSMYTPEEQAKNNSALYLTIANFVPTTLIIGQGASFSWNMREQAKYREKWQSQEIIERMVQ